MMQKKIFPSHFEQIAIEEHAVSGPYEALYELYGLSAKRIAEKVVALLS
jgi:transketolase